MKVDLGIWSTLTQVVIALVVVALMILAGVKYVPIIQQNERMRREILRLDDELNKQEAMNKRLREDIDALRNNPDAIARLVRRDLRYAKPDETVFLFETNQANVSH